jgi:hypothetical protein
MRAIFAFLRMYLEISLCGHFPYNYEEDNSVLCAVLHKFFDERYSQLGLEGEVGQSHCLYILIILNYLPLEDISPSIKVKHEATSWLTKG